MSAQAWRSVRAAVAAFVTLLAVATVAGAFLSVYPGTSSVPKGADTPTYVWRLRVVAELGLDALPAIEGSHLLNGNADRPGLPAAYATLRTLGAPDAWNFAYVFPAVMAVAIGLTGLVIGRGALRQPRAAAPAYVLVVGVAVPLAFAANGKYAEMMASGLLLAGVAMLPPALHRRRGAAAAVVLCFVAAWAAQWGIAAGIGLAIGIGVALWIALVPRSFECRRSVALRRLAVTAAACVIGAIAVAMLAPARPQPPLEVLPGIVADNLARQIPAYVWSPLIPAAVLGALALARRTGYVRASLGVLIAWCSLPAAGLVWNVAATDIPVYRMLSSALAIPVLAAAGVIAVAAAIRGRSGPARLAVSTAFAVGLVALLVTDAYDVWRTRHPATSPHVAASMAALGRSIGSAGRPIVLAVDRRKGEDASLAGFGTIPALRRLRAALPADAIPTTVVYLGDPDRLLAGEITLEPSLPGFDARAREAWLAVAPLMSNDPIILVLRQYHDAFASIAREHPDWVVAPWLLVARGPLVDVPAWPVADRAPGWDRLVRWTALVVAILALVGGGWAVALLSDDPISGLALGPVAGLAALALAGTIVESAGARASGVVGVTAAVALAVAGWLWGAARWWVARAHEDGAALDGSKDGDAVAETGDSLAP